MPKYRKHKDKYRPGDFKVRCDNTGLTYMDSECAVQWDGLKVSKENFDIKHPQLIIYPHQDKIAVDNARPTAENDDDLPFGEGNRNDL